MPNLAGVFHRDGFSRTLEPVLSRQAEVLSVRGLGFTCCRWSDGRFGAVNLLKADVDELEQPARMPDGRLLFLDGEIYNLGELSRDEVAIQRGDGPVARCLALYARDPIATARRLNGSFNLAYYDPRRRVLQLVSDRLGSRPLYYQESHGALYFALEQKAILAAHARAPRFDDLGVLQLAAFGHQLGDRTLFSGISVLPPGSILTATPDGVTITSYWRAAYAPGGPVGRDAAVEFAQRFVAATRRRTLDRRAPLGIFLSGGLDSRCVAGALARVQAPVTAFTFGDESSRDVRFARQIASRLGFSHRTYNHKGLDLTAALPRVAWRMEGTMSFPEGLSIAFHRHIRPEARLIFNGHLGDMLSGAHLVPELLWLRRRDLADHILRRRTVLPRERLRALFLPDRFDALHARLVSSVEDGLRRFDEERPALLYNLWDLDVRQRRYTQSTPAVDRPALEQISPFLDNDVVEFLLGLPLTELFGQRCYLRAILDAFPACADVPWARTGRPIESNHALRLARLGGDSVLRKSRRVLGLGSATPSSLPDEAFRSPALRALAEASLRSEAFPDHLFDRAAAQAMIERHFDGGGDRLEEVGLLLTLSAADRLLGGDLRAVPAEAQPDLPGEAGGALGPVIQWQLPQDAAVAYRAVP